MTRMKVSKTARKWEIWITFACKIEQQLFKSRLPKGQILVMFSLVLHSKIRTWSI